MSNYSGEKPNLASIDDDYEYTLGSGQATILKYIGSDSDVIIPTNIAGYTVTTIGDGAFLNYTTLKSISLSLVTTIETTAFAGCVSLESVSGDYVESVGSYAFSNCEAVKDIKLLNVKHLNEYAFSYCLALESISLPLISELPTKIFINCYSLKNIDLSNIKTIGAFAFKSCSSLETIYAPEATYIDYGAFSYSSVKEVDFINVSEINYEAFLNCSVLEEVNIPSAIAIGDNAFKDTGTKCLCLSSELSQIGSDVFTNSQVEGLTIDYGVEDISLVTEEDWYEFADRVTGLNVQNIIGRYAKNNLDYLNLDKNDKEPPVLTLNGESEMTLEVGLSTYIDDGVTISENYCEEIEVVITGEVNTSKIGNYILSYDATDHNGNKAIQVKRNINVIDTTAPVITLNGERTVIIPLGTAYVEDGAVVRDNSGEDIIASVSGVVDDSKLGQYIETYTAKDSSGNEAIPICRTVNIVNNALVSCSQIVCYNNRGVVTKWAIYTIDDVLVYITDNYLADEEFILNLDTLTNLVAGTLFYIKAVVEGDDAESPVTLQYTPNSYTTYFELDYTDSNTNDFSKINYNGIIYSAETPPTIECNEIFTANLAWVAASWDYFTLDGKKLFTTGPYPIGNLVVLSNYNITPGTVFKMKASVDLGDDSSPYLYFKFEPSVDVTPYITLIGTAFKTCAMYSGLYDE